MIKNYYKFLFILIGLISFLFSNKIVLKDANSSSDILSIDDRYFEVEKEHLLDNKISSSSTFYQIQNNQDINATFSYSSISKEIVNDIPVEALKESYGYEFMIVL